MPIPKADRIGWFLILFLAAVALVAALYPAVAKADAPSLVDRLIAVQPSLASHKDEPVDAREFAAAVATVSKGDRQWAALLTTLAVHESGLSDRIRRGEFKDYEGDAFKNKDGSIQHLAFGLWQCHANQNNASDWGSTDVAVQARVANRMARGAAHKCEHSGVAFPLYVFRAYGGRQCDMPLKGEERRMQTYSRLLRRL